MHYLRHLCFYYRIEEILKVLGFHWCPLYARFKDLYLIHTCLLGDRTRLPDTAMQHGILGRGKQRACGTYTWKCFNFIQFKITTDIAIENARIGLFSDDLLVLLHEMMRPDELFEICMASTYWLQYIPLQFFIYTCTCVFISIIMIIKYLCNFLYQILYIHWAEINTKMSKDMANSKVSLPQT